MVSFGFSPCKLSRAFALPFQMHVGNKLSHLGREWFEQPRKVISTDEKYGISRRFSPVLLLYF